MGKDIQTKLEKLYNRRQKIDFLTTYQGRSGTKRGPKGRNRREGERISPEEISSVYLNTFLKFAEEEKKKDTDLCLWSTEEIQEVLNKMAGASRVSGMTSRMRVLKAYFEWCGQQGIPHSDGAEGIKPPETDENIRNTMVSGPKQLKEYLDEMFGPEDGDKTIKNVYRAYFWLAFGGVLERDVCELKTRHVNLVDRQIEFNGFSYTIYDEAFQSILKCTTLKSFDFWHAPTGSMATTDRPDGTQLLRGMKTDASLMNLNGAIFRATKDLKKRLKKKKSEGFLTENEEKWLDSRINYSTVYLSGIFYRVYNLPIPVEDNDFSDVAAEILSARWYSRNKNESKSVVNEKQRIWLMNREFQKDYEVWKRVFADELK